MNLEELEHFQFPLWDTEVKGILVIPIEDPFNSLYGILEQQVQLHLHLTNLSIPFMGYISPKKVILFL